MDFSDFDDRQLALLRSVLAAQYHKAKADPALDLMRKFSHAAVRDIDDEIDRRAGVLDALDPDLEDGIIGAICEPEQPVASRSDGQDSGWGS